MPYLDRGGVRVHYQVRGDGVPLLMCNGWGPPVEWMTELYFPNFSDRFRCATYDLRGMGRTDAPENDAAYAMREIAQDGIAVMDELGWKTAHVWGASMGANQASIIAILAPERVRSLCISGPDLGIPNMFQKNTPRCCATGGPTPPISPSRRTIRRSRPAPGRPGWDPPSATAPRLHRERGRRASCAAVAASPPAKGVRARQGFRRWLRSLAKRSATNAEAAQRRGSGCSGRTHYRAAVTAVARADTSIRDFQTCAARQGFPECRLECPMKKLSLACRMRRRVMDDATGC